MSAKLFCEHQKKKHLNLQNAFELNSYSSSYYIPHWKPNNIPPPKQMADSVWHVHCFSELLGEWWPTVSVKSGLIPNLRLPDFVCFLLSIFRMLASWRLRTQQWKTHLSSETKDTSSITLSLICILNFSPVYPQLMCSPLKKQQLWS